MVVPMPTAGPQTEATTGLAKAPMPCRKSTPRQTLRRRGLLQKIGNVIARGEDARIALEHEHAHASIGLCRSQRIGQRRVHGAGEGVLLGHTLESDAAHAGCGVNQDVLVGFGHGASGSAWSGAALRAASFLVVDD